MAKTDTDPQALFMNWMRLATRREPSDAQAAAFATLGADGMADVRMVLVRRVDDRGVIFFTNRLSRKAKQLDLEPSGALCFHWKSLGRQVRMRGKVELASDEESDHYFARRARASQLGAHASKQSHLLASREDLTHAFDKFKKSFPVRRCRVPIFGAAIVWCRLKLSSGPGAHRGCMTDCCFRAPHREASGGRKNYFP